MLVVNPKYKPIITKPGVSPPTAGNGITSRINGVEDYNSSIVSKFQGQGINELIQKVKDIKIKEIQKKKHENSKNKISFE
jgi:hypothetical protein